MTAAVRTIEREHVYIERVLACLSHLVQDLAMATRTPDFNLLFAIVDYLEAFPETFHHPKEEDYLFEAIRRRRPAAAAMLDDICDEHARGRALLAELRLGLESLRRRPSARTRFQLAASTYVDFERKHMIREEQEVLPLALEALEYEDWGAIDAEFERNRDPLFGAGRRMHFDALFGYIMDLASTPGDLQAEEVPASAADSAVE